MKLLTFIFAFLFLVSCGQKNKNNSNNQISALASDTLMAGNYILTFQNSDSFPVTDIYGDSEYRIQLTDSIDNAQMGALKIQSYLLTQSGDYFFATDSGLVLKLSNNKTLFFASWDEERDEGYNFEHYFKNIDYYLLRVQWEEGNCWMLVNRKNGFKKYISGLPYISNDNKRIITINSDLEAGYSFNGLELYTILADSLHREFSEETEWGPTDVKWIDEDQFLLKREHFRVDSITNNQDYDIDYKRVTIEKKTNQ